MVDKKTSPAFVGSEGYITDEVLKAHAPPPSDDSMILVCGPPPMMKAISGEKNEDKSQGVKRSLSMRFRCHTLTDSHMAHEVDRTTGTTTSCHRLTSKHIKLMETKLTC